MDNIRISKINDKYCIDCTKIVSGILGEGLVKKAYLRLPVDSEMSDKQQIDNAKKLAVRMEKEYSKDGKIWFDNDELAIELISGKTILIKGSEWGSLSSISNIYQ